MGSALFYNATEFSYSNGGLRHGIGWPLFLAGMSYRPATQINIETSVDWTNWNSIDTAMFKAANPIGSGDFVWPLKWDSSWFYHVGVSQYFGTGLFASLTYFFRDNFSSERHLIPYIPDSDLHLGSIGAGYKGTHWRCAIAGQFISSAPRTIDNQPSSFSGEAASEKFSFFVPAVTISVGFRF